LESETLVQNKTRLKPSSPSFARSIIDSEEIIEARWIDLDEYFNHKDIVKTVMKGRGLKLGTHNYFTKEEQHEYYF